MRPAHQGGSHSATTTEARLPWCAGPVWADPAWLQDSVTGAAAGICAREVALSVATHTHRRVARARRGPFYMLHLQAVSHLARESLTKAVPAPRPVILARRRDNVIPIADRALSPSRLSPSRAGELGAISSCIVAKVLKYMLHVHAHVHVDTCATCCSFPRGHRHHHPCISASVTRCDTLWKTHPHDLRSRHRRPRFLSAFASSTAAIHLRTCSRYLHRPLRLRRPCCLRSCAARAALRCNFTAGRR